MLMFLPSGSHHQLQHHLNEKKRERERKRRRSNEKRTFSQHSNSYTCKNVQLFGRNSCRTIPSDVHHVGDIWLAGHGDLARNANPQAETCEGGSDRSEGRSEGRSDRSRGEKGQTKKARPAYVNLYKTHINEGFCSSHYALVVRCWLA